MEWRTIESAPKNEAGKFYGPIILIFCIADDLPWPVYWGPGGPDNVGAWCAADDGQEFDGETVTHWMPLPHSPTA